MKKCLLYKYICLLLLLFGMGLYGYAQTAPVPSTEGTEFWLVFMNNLGIEETDPTLKLKVCVVGEEQVDITVRKGAGSAVLGTLHIPAGGGMDSLLLSPSDAYVGLTLNQTSTAQIPQQKGVYLSADDHNTKFSCFGYIEAGPVGFTGRDMSLILPKQALGKEYMVQTYPDDGNSTEFVILATEDNTEVTIVPSVDTYQSLHLANAKWQLPVLSQGQSVLVPSITAGNRPSIDLSGSTICANKPIAVFVGNQSTKIKQTDSYTDDHIYEHIPPVDNWGKSFYVALAGSTLRNKVQVTSLTDNTTVTIRRSVGAVQTVIMSAGQSLATPIELSNTIKNVTITADKPVMCYSYLSSAGYNQETTINSQTWEEVVVNWGDPANAMVPAWTNRVRQMTFYTEQLKSDDPDVPHNYYVQLVTSATDAGSIMVDGVTIPSSDYSSFAGDPSIVYVNYNLNASTPGAHFVETTGNGFVGFVHGVTEGMGYQYTLGYNPKVNPDSLFIANTGDVVMQAGYGLAAMSQGWFQRQPYDFAEEYPEKLDTAYVCDSTRIDYTMQLAGNERLDSVVWVIYDCDSVTGRPYKDHFKERYTDGTNTATDYNWSYMFALDPQDGRPAEQRSKYEYFQVCALVYKQRVICDDYGADIDTFRTMVHVARLYDDTLYNVICMGDSVRFFYDDASHTKAYTDEASLDSTLFVSAANHTADTYVETYVLGDNVYRRQYVTRSGCDSIVTYILHVCDTFHYVIDTFVCENQLPLVIPGWFAGQTLDKEQTYYDTLRTHACDDYKPWRASFNGCDSIMEVRLHVGKVARDTSWNNVWCTNGDNTLTYDWYDAVTGSLIRTVTQNDIEWVDEPQEKRFVGFFSDTLQSYACSACYGGSCDSIRVLHLIKPYRVEIWDSARICDFTYNDADGSLYWDPVINAFEWTGHQTDLLDPSMPRQIWNNTTGERINADDIQHLAAGEYILTDTLQTVYGCDSLCMLKMSICHTFLQVDKHRMADNEEYDWHGYHISGLPENAEPYVFHDSAVSSADGCSCDSIYRLELKVSSTFYDFQTARVCDDSVFIWKGHKNDTAIGPLPSSINEPKGYYSIYDSLKMTQIVDGQPVLCDSVWELRLTVDSTYKHDVYEYICDTETVVFDRYTYKASRFALPYPQIATFDTTIMLQGATECACDSQVTLHLTIYPRFYQFDSIQLCTDDSVFWPHRVDAAGDSVSVRINQTGLYTLWDSTHTQYGCDSVYELRVYVTPAYVDTDRTVIIDSICSINLPYVWNGHVDASNQPMEFNASGSYYDTLHTSACACDSVIELRLTVVQNQNSTRDTTICQTEAPFVFGGQQWYFSPSDSVAGDYVRMNTVHAGFGCDYFEILVIHLNPAYLTLMEYDTVCQQQDSLYHWRGQTLSLDNAALLNAVDSQLTVGCNCDSITTLALTVLPSYTFYDTIIMSDEDTCHWQGRVYGGPYTLKPHDIAVTADTTVIDTFMTTVSGSALYCDSVRVLRLRVGRIYRDTVDTFVCANVPFDWYRDGRENADSLIMAGLTVEDWYIDQHYTQFGFDSVYYLHLRHYPYYPVAPERTHVDSVCQGTAYLWKDMQGRMLYDVQNSQWIDPLSIPVQRVGLYTYRDSALTDIHGCDSVWTLELRVDSVYDAVDTFTICDNDTLLWHERLYVGEHFEGTYDPSRYKMVAAALPAQMNFNDDTVYHTIHGCDSTWRLVLNILPAYVTVAPSDTDFVHICDNHTYQFYDSLCNAAGEWVTSAHGLGDDAVSRYIMRYVDTTVLGCDSAVAHVVYVHPTYSLSDPDTFVCCTAAGVSGFEWIGHTDAGHSIYVKELDSYTNVIRTDSVGWFTLVDSLKSLSCSECGVVGGCDSVWTIRLYVAPVYEFDSVYTICDNSSVVWQRRMYMGVNYDTLMYGVPAAQSADYDTLIYLPVSSLYKDTMYYHTDVYGCDSTYRMLLNIQSVVFTHLRDTISDNNFTWTFGHADKYHEGSEYAVADLTDLTRTPYTVFLVDTLQTFTGCDSIVHDSLTICPEYLFVDSTATCTNDELNWRKYTFLNRLRSGIYYDSLKTIYGTDSVYALKLSILPSFEVTLNRRYCKNDTIPWQWQTIYYDPFFGSDEVTFDAKYQTISESCDSIYHLHVYFHDYYHFEADTAYICQGDTFQWFHTDGWEHTQALYDEAGNHLLSVPTDTIGWITVYDSLKTVSCGCDSTYTLRLLVSPAYHFYDTIGPLCTVDTAFWRDTFFVSDTAMVADYREDYSTTGFGCDSVFHLHLIYNQTYDMGWTYDTVCAEQKIYSWHTFTLDTLLQQSIDEGWQFDSTFVFTQIYGTVDTCDSVYHLSLTVLPYIINEYEDTICRSEQYTFHTQLLTDSGTYTDVFVNEFGCNQYDIVHLAVLEPTRFNVDSVFVCADQSSFEVPFTFEGERPLSYSLYFGAYARSQGFADVKGVVIPQGDSSLTVAMPVSYSSHTAYPRPDDYSAVIVFDNGYCTDTALLTVPLYFRILYPSWIIEQHWNDAVFILDSAYNGNYRFVSYQWYRDDEPMYGKEEPWLYQPHWLDTGARYSVALVRQGENYAIRTCDLVPDHSRIDETLMPKQSYISVVPTWVSRLSPLVDILAPVAGNYTVADSFGRTIASGRYVPDDHAAFSVMLPAIAGVYVLKITDDEGHKRSVKVIVQ